MIYRPLTSEERQEVSDLESQVNTIGTNFCKKFDLENYYKFDNMVLILMERELCGVIDSYTKLIDKYNEYPLYAKKQKARKLRLHFMLYRHFIRKQLCNEEVKPTKQEEFTLNLYKNLFQDDKSNLNQKLKFKNNYKNR